MIPVRQHDKALIVITAASIAVLSLRPVFPATGAGGTGNGPSVSPEYKVKAAFLYNFIKFVEWPEEKLGEPNKPIVIGIVGKDRFGNAFEPVKNKPVKKRRLIIERFKYPVIPNKPTDRQKKELAHRIKQLGNATCCSYPPPKKNTSSRCCRSSQQGRC